MPVLRRIIKYQCVTNENTTSDTVNHDMLHDLSAVCSTLTAIE